MNGMRVFLLESDPIIIDTFIKVFTLYGRGHSLQIARGCGEALRTYKPPYSLILINHELRSETMSTGTDYVILMPASPIAQQPWPLVFVYTKNADAARKMVAILHNKNYRATWMQYGRALIEHLERQSNHHSFPKIPWPDGEPEIQIAASVPHLETQMP